MSRAKAIESKRSKVKAPPPPESESDSSVSSTSEAESKSSHDVPQSSKRSDPPSPVHRGRGRPKVKESYDTAEYSKKFRDKAAPFYCEACDCTVSYFSKLRHLSTIKHRKNEEGAQ